MVSLFYSVYRNLALPYPRYLHALVRTVNVKTTSQILICIADVITFGSSRSITEETTMPIA
jgi:hypothetical protein